MSYVTRHETETSLGGPLSVPVEQFRKLTASQGSRSELYDVAEVTGQAARRGRLASTHSFHADAEHRIPASASILHVERLLKSCASLAESLLEAKDEPVESALTGARLLSCLDELWEHRATKELEWVQILNLLQIVLGNEEQEFETMSETKRLALARVFKGDMFSGRVHRTESDRIIEILSGAGFDVWRGIS